MSTSSTNYRESVFRHPDLTKIHGEPTFATLTVLSRELKANAKSVHATLGGAAHGHLGLVLSPAQYALVSETPYVRVLFPAPLAIPVGTTRLAAEELERNHKEEIRAFRELTGVENALKTQLLKAVEPAYVAAILDPVTYDLAGTIYDNLHFLMTTYGKVTPEQVNEEYEKVNNIIYNPTLPIDSIFNAIIELSELAEAGENPYTPQQQITICYNILNRSGRMTQDIKEWNRRPALLKNWTTFKTFFRRVHTEIRATSNDTVEAMQHANIARHVIDGIRHLIPPAPDEEGIEPHDTPTPAALSVTDPTTVIIPSLISQITQMQTMMMNMQSSMCGHDGGRGRGGRFGQVRGRGRGRGQERGALVPLVFTKYCWTHGLCMHIGSECFTPAEGHKPQATVQNKMGGSTRNVV